MRRRLTGGTEEELNMTPMLDIVFIMLIFFIVTASFVKEAGIEVERPEALTPQPLPLANILIAINGEGQIWIDKQEVDPSDIRASLERILADTPNGQVVIQADKEAKNGYTLQVLDAARAVGVEEVSIAARQI